MTTQSECSKHSSLPGLDVREAVFPRINRNHGNQYASCGPAAHPAADGQEEGPSQMSPGGSVTPPHPWDLLGPPSLSEVGLRSSGKISPDFGFLVNLKFYYLILFFLLVPESMS